MLGLEFLHLLIILLSKFSILLPPFLTCHTDDNSTTPLPMWAFLGLN